MTPEELLDVIGPAEDALRATEERVAAARRDLTAIRAAAESGTIPPIVPEKALRFAAKASATAAAAHSLHLAGERLIRYVPGARKVETARAVSLRLRTVREWVSGFIGALWSIVREARTP